MTEWANGMTSASSVAASWALSITSGSHTNRDTCARELRRVIRDLRDSLDSVCEFCQDGCTCKKK